MAVLQNDPKDLEEEQGGIKTLGSGSSGVVGTTNDKPATAGGASGQWTNLSQYRDANQQGAEKMAGQIGANIGAERQELQGDIDTSAQAYQQSLAPKTDLAQSKSEIADAFTSGDDYQAAIDAWKAKGGTNYTAPVEQQQAWDTSEYQQRQSDLQNRLDATKTETGRLSELSRLHKPQTTRGQGLLDQYLMQTSANPQDMFAGQQNLGVGDLSTQQQANADALAQLQGYRANTAEDIAGLGDYYGNTLNTLQSDVRDYQNNVSSLNDLQNTENDVQTQLQNARDYLAQIFAGNTQGTPPGVVQEQILNFQSQLQDIQNDKSNLITTLDSSEVAQRQAKQQALAELMGEAYTPSELSTY